MILGITGHQELEHTASWLWVEQILRRRLESLSQTIVGVSALAIGADQLFARIVLEANGQLWAIIPFAEYEETFDSESARSAYYGLVKRASRTEVLERLQSLEETFLAAGRRVVDRSDVLWAVWDGQAAGGIGGTADVVAYALQVQKPVLHINPTNSSITELPQEL